MKLSEYAKKNSITYRTAFSHWKAGLIRGKQLATGTIVVEDIEDLKIQKDKNFIIYCRVSSHDQKEDLQRQIVRLTDYCSAKGYKVSKVESEIASGLNDKRDKLLKVLKSDCHIIVEHKDRLTRFGFNYIKELLELQGRKIEIINEVEDDKEDLVQDFVSIITSMCARVYGKRRNKRKTEKLIKELQKDED